MRYIDAVAKCRELGNKAQEHADTAERASRTYTATMELFQVAATVGDEKAMEQHRQSMHTCVDTILDEGAMQQRLLREIKRISQSVTDFPQT